MKIRSKATISEWEFCKYRYGNSHFWRTFSKQSVSKLLKLLCQPCFHYNLTKLLLHNNFYKNITFTTMSSECHFHKNVTCESLSWCLGDILSLNVSLYWKWSWAWVSPHSQVTWSLPWPPPLECLAFWVKLVRWDFRKLSPEWWNNPQSLCERAERREIKLF